MNTSLLNLSNDGIISEKTAYSYTTNPENLGNKIYYLGKRKNMEEDALNSSDPASKKKAKDKADKKGRKAVSKDALNNLVSAPSNDDAAYSSKWEDNADDWGDWGDDEKSPAKAPAAPSKAKGGKVSEHSDQKKHGLFGKKK